MCDELLGYLLGGLESEEHEKVKQVLESDSEARRKLETLRRTLEPLEADFGHVEKPSGLAGRTCRLVHMRSTPSLEAPLIDASARWRIQDLLVAAAVLAAATLLLLPAVNVSRKHRDIVVCANNLRAIGMALSDYSEAHNGYFPYVPPEGRLAVAGIYGPTLLQSQYVTEPTILFCPADHHSPRPDPPDLARFLQLAPDSPHLVDYQQMIGGSYGYGMGYRDEQRIYRGARNQRRAHFAMMADQPPRPESGAGSLNSPNHGGSGQNVWYEDGHVRWVLSRTVGVRRNDIFINDEGQIAAGVGPNDSIIGCSEAGPNGF